jgi:ABC-type sugar transport system substrate-binding protein
MTEMLRIGMLPKNTENAYFAAARRGATEAAAELRAELLWDGPQAEDPAHQVALLEVWARAGVDVIAVSASDSPSVSPALREARGRGVRVMTWDADAAPDARQFHVAQATPEGVGQALASEASRVLLGKGEFAIITSTLAAPNQQAWIQAIRASLARTSPQVQLVEVAPCCEDSTKAEAEATRLLQTHPRLGAIVTLCTPALLPTAGVVQRSGRGVKVVGTGTPQGCQSHIKERLIESVVGWNPVDLGYLTVYTAHSLASGVLSPGEGTLLAGRLGRILVKGDEVRLGRTHVWSRANLETIPD